MRLIEQNSQVTPIMPSSPIIACALLGGEAAQHRVDPLGRAAADVGERRRLEHPHAALVEQADTAAARSTASGRSARGPRSSTAQRLGLDPGVVFGRRRAAPCPRARRRDGDRLRRPLRRVGQELRDAGRRRASSRLPASRVCADREPHQRRDLLGALEIVHAPPLPGPGPPARRRPDSATCRRRDRW